MNERTEEVFRRGKGGGIENGWTRMGENKIKGKEDGSSGAESKRQRECVYVEQEQRDDFC